MQPKLPSDLATIRTWCVDGIQAIWDLHRARTHEAMRESRDRLFSVVDNLPNISEDLDRELTRASGAECETRPEMVGVTALNAVDAVWRNCELALRIVHAQSLKHIRNQFELWRSSPSAERPQEYAEWEKALATGRAISDAPDTLTHPTHREVLNAAFNVAPVFLCVPPDAPPLPMTIHRPGGELTVWIDKVLTRVRDQRSENVKPSRQEPPQQLAEASSEPLTDNEALVLEHLCSSQTTRFIYDLAHEIKRDRKTVGKILAGFAKRGLASRPKGENSGYAVTDAGRALHDTLYDSLEPPDS